MPINLLRGIKGVILDIDNTLLATNEFVKKNIIQTVERMNAEGHHISIPPSAEINAVLGANLPFEDIFSVLFVGKGLSEAILANFRAHAKAQKYIAAPGAVDAVNWLNRQGILVGLVTNRVKMIEERLQQAGFLLDQFVCICQPETPEFRKPNPRSLDTALAVFSSKGVQADQLVVVGDHTDDYYPAHYQNIKFVGIMSGFTTQADFVRAGLAEKLVILSLTELQSALTRAVEIEIYQKSLQNSSALDGRYALSTQVLSNYFSEFAFHKYRIRAEVEHLITLSEFFIGKVVRPLTDEEKKYLRQLYQNFSAREAFEVLQYDHLGRNGVGPVEHDTKAGELWIKEKLTGTSLADVIPFIHIFLTSEDVRNLALKLMLSEASNDVFVPKVLEITERLRQLATENIGVSVMARTHLQPASPTTFGKIFGGYLVRLTRGLARLYALTLSGKVNGAVGNYNAFVAAYPDLDWIKYSKELIRRLGLEAELWTEQRGTHTDVIQAFQIIQEIGNVIRDFAVDLSLYSAFGEMYFAKVDSHVGSSVMPHKINPWWCEVAEGNIKKANGLINVFANELDVSRLQRDLSDHDLERSYGEAFGYVYVALDHIATALSLLRIDADQAASELLAHPEILSEAIQTVMRVNGVVDSYEIIKTAFRGNKVNFDDVVHLVDSLNLPLELKSKIFFILSPRKYTGLAEELARQAVAFYDNYRINAVGKYLSVN